ncbi:oxidoreductase-like protein [Oceaniovalibus guishaninsula JLT2003]|uniref:Oxidoreductase-like protein n=2 Tax=Oceaniovalibus TaxID=1207070 RepID=K2IA60_9RHOB|nr:oxidoreductase-like protein [Oceaniovalibus guishaninsula JLT2003]
MAPAIHGARGSTLAAIASRDPAKAATFVELVPDVTIHDGYDALLDDPHIDAVYIPLPNHLHVEWSLKALHAGKHLLCEKPMAMHAAEFDALIRARDKTGRLAAEAFMIVHHPQWTTIRDLLAAGTIGPLVHVDAVFTYDNGNDPQNIRNLVGMGGGGLRDIGVYTFGSVRFATGQEPLGLTARLRMEKDFDTFAEVNADFPGFTYHAIVSTRMRKRQQVVFHGRTGILTLTTPFNAGVYDQAELRIETDENEVTIRRWPGVNQYVLQVEAFTHAASTGSTYVPSLEFSKGTQAMIDAALAQGG